MMVYRLAIEKYQDDLSGTGSKLFGGRWNYPGLAAIYTSENISLSVLEIIANADRQQIPLSYFLLKIFIPETIDIKLVEKKKLKKDWNTDFEYSQFIGNSFLQENKQCVLKVPSAIVKEEYNFIINPEHVDMKKIKITATNSFDIDIRLTRK